MSRAQSVAAVTTGSLGEDPQADVVVADSLAVAVGAATSHAGGLAAMKVSG